MKAIPPQEGHNNPITMTQIMILGQLRMETRFTLVGIMVIKGDETLEATIMEPTTETGAMIRMVDTIIGLTMEETGVMKDTILETLIIEAIMVARTTGMVQIMEMVTGMVAIGDLAMVVASLNVKFAASVDTLLLTVFTEMIIHRTMHHLQLWIAKFVGRKDMLLLIASTGPIMHIKAKLHHKL